MLSDEIKQRQWLAYARSINLEGLALEEVLDVIWDLIGPACARIATG